jgi:hypothetical protein
MSKDAQPPPDPAVWQAQNLRVILFPEDPRAALHRDWWKDLTGNEPDSSIRKKVEREDAGIHSGMMLVASVDPLRLQWTVARAMEDALIEGAPVLGPYPEKRDEFVALMTRWLPSCPPVKRIGFVASLLQEVPQRDDGYRLLNQYLPYVEVHTDSSDFMYRVNRRRASKSPVPSLSINGLATWSSVKILTSMTAFQGELPGKEVEKAERHYCALELDVNTVPDFQGILPPEHLAVVLQELAGVASDIAARGDQRVD